MLDLDKSIREWNEVEKNLLSLECPEGEDDRNNNNKIQPESKDPARGQFFHLWNVIGYGGV